MEQQTTKKEKTIFNCEKCNKGFDNLEDLSIHKKSHTKSMSKDNSLEKLKNEIINEVGAKNKKNKLQWGSAAVTMVLILLTLFSIAQTVQSATILNKIESGDIKSNNSSGIPLPSSLENLPNMVGGC